MQTISIEWHRTPSSGNARVPEMDLIALFRTVGVDLRIREGPKLHYSPSSTEHFSTLEKLYRPRGVMPGLGHLFLVRTARDGLPDVLGEVFGKTHGLAIIYVSRLLEKTPSDSMLAVCAHEIGHMCNLTHNLADVSNFDSVMKPSAKQDDHLPTAWRNAQREAVNHGVPAAVFDELDLNCFPFNHQCRMNLAKPSQHWGPWTGPFIGAGQGESHTLTTAACQILVHPHFTSCVTGTDLAFDVELINKSKVKTITVPLHLHCDFGNLYVTVQSAYGTRRYTPVAHACSPSTTEITPGNSAFFPVALGTDQLGKLLNRPARYIIDVEMRFRVKRQIYALTSRFEVDVRAPLRQLAPSAGRSLAARPASSAQRPGRDMPPVPAPVRQRASKEAAPAQDPIVSRAATHADILALAAVMPMGRLRPFVEKIRDRFPDKRDAVLHLKLLNTLHSKGGSL